MRALLVLMFALVSAQAQAANCVAVDVLFGSDDPYAAFLAPVMSGESTSNPLIEKMEKALAKHECLALVSEVADRGVMTAAFFYLDVSSDGSRVTGQTHVYNRIEGRALPEGCENMDELDLPTRLSKCYNFKASGRVSEESDAYSTFTVFAGNGATLGEAITDSGRQTISEIAYQEKLVKKLVEANGLAKTEEQLRQSLLLTRARYFGGFALRAAGFTPDLLATDFWKSTGKPSERDYKIVEAAKFLNARGLGFADLNVGGETIVKLAEFKMPRFITLMGYDLEHSLTKAMETAGFEYVERAWRETKKQD